MLRVVDLQSGTSLSCSLTAESTASQVVVALKKRKSLGGTASEDDSTRAIYGVWCDTKQRIRARRLRGDDKPLLLVSHLKRTTGAAPKLAFTADSASSRLILAKTTLEDEVRAFAQRGIILDGSGDSEFFSVIQRLGAGDMCGYLFTNFTDTISGKTESALRWWVLQGERLWFQPSHEDETRYAIALANNKVLGPWAGEFELQTTVSGFRLIALSATDAKAWVELLDTRIKLATENELIACADVLIADEEKARWKKIESRLSRLDTLDGWCESETTINQLCRFARTDGSEYLLLFYVDAESALKSGTSLNPLAVVKRFMSLASLPQSLQTMRMELLTMMSDPNSPAVSRDTLLRLVSVVKKELGDGLLKRMKANDHVYERYLAELPVLLSVESNCI